MNRTIWIGVIVMIVLVAGGWWYFNRSDTSAIPQTAPQSVSATPNTWPSDTPANYPGAIINDSDSLHSIGGAPGITVVYRVRATEAPVIDYYKSQLTSTGWNFRDANDEPGTVGIFATKGARVLRVYAVMDANTGLTSVTVSLEI